MCGIWAMFGSGNMEKYFNSIQKIAHRGPDGFRIKTSQTSCIAFHRLAVNGGLSAMQPLVFLQHPFIYLVYNGEIYNYKEIQKRYRLNYESQCDGEAIIHLYVQYGIEFAAKQLGGVFSFCLLDTKANTVFLGRDTFGVKPLFRITTSFGLLAVCSEAKDFYNCKGLQNVQDTNMVSCGMSKTKVFTPGYVEAYTLDSNGKAFRKGRTRFHTVGTVPKYTTEVLNIAEDDVAVNIRRLLESSVRKRMMADRRIGCLLSGGLDSSLITAVTVKVARELNLNYNVQTFSIGLKDSVDLKAAREVADYLGTDHHEIVVSGKQVIEAIEDVIYTIESYDGATVRSSIGMYLVSKYIKESTDSIVVMSGEGADEVCQGYEHFHLAPSADAADEESRKLCRDLHYFDVLRADRTTARFGLEIRVPFLDHLFSNYYLCLPNQLRIPKDGIEKFLLRSAFSNTGMLPDNILWRAKSPLSNGVSSLNESWYDIFRTHSETQIEDVDFESESIKYSHNMPRTKEDLLYRQIFEKFYPGMGEWIPHFWTPAWKK